MTGKRWSALALVLTMTSQLCFGETVDRLVGDYDAFVLSRDPVLAGQQGDRAALRRWPDDSPIAAAAAKAQLEEFKRRAEAIPASALPATQQLNLALLLHSVSRQLGEMAFDSDRIPFYADSGFNQVPDYVAQNTKLRSGEDAEAWLARLEALPTYYATEIANARRGLDDGFVQARVAVEASLTVARAQADAPVEKSALLAPLRDQLQFKARALRIITETIKPAQRRFVTFLERDYLSKARSEPGIRGLPRGDRYYEFLVRRYTTTDLPPDEIHAIGLKEVARIRAEMDRVMHEAGFKSSFAEFLSFLRHDPSFYASTPEALLEKASEIAKRIDGQLPAWFGTLPRLTYGVRAVPTEIAESYTTGRYWPGTPEQGIAGAFMINTSHLDQRPLYELPALTLHEAVPGHHLQIALAQENRDIPLFRRNDDMTVFVEGWALYAEKLGVEMGIYRTPFEQFGRLSFEMWRACRLVIDTGLHWKGWSRDEARRTLAENTALSDKNIDVEIDRYIGWPGQALAYKIGELRILELRRAAEAALGDRFDIRQFHDALLANGPLPLDLLSRQIDAWIASRKN